MKKSTKIGVLTGITIIIFAILFGIAASTGNAEIESPSIKLLCVFLGFLGGICLVATIFTACGKKGKKEVEYDERQKVERGKAFRFGFFFYMGYFVLELMLAASEITLPVDDVMQPMIGMLLGLLAMTTYAIWHDAYVELNTSKKQTYGMLIGVGAANLLIGLSNLGSGKCVVDGVLTFRAVNIVIGVMFIYLVVLFAIKNYVDKKEAADEES